MIQKKAKIIKVKTIRGDNMVLGGTIGSSMIASVFTNPIALTTATHSVNSSGVIFNTLYKALMPFVWDVGKVLLYVGCVQGIYCIMRANTKQAIDRIKNAAVGYAMLRFIDVFVNLIDGIAKGMVLE